MNNEEYNQLVNSVIKKEHKFKNVIISFFSGGLIGLISQIIVYALIKYLNVSLSDSYLLSFMFYIVLGSFLTGFGIFDKVLSVCKCGLIVPCTGFANAMSSSALDYRSEGFVKGIGANIFKLTGSVILYGVVFGILFGFVRSII